MNIFEVLSQGRGRLNEENLSAMLGYLLSPLQTHGLGDIFLRSFVQAASEKIGEEDWFSQILKNKSSIKADVLLESPYEFGKSRRIVDIDIRIYASHSKRAQSSQETSEIHRIAIENKVKVQSVGNDQLKQEFSAIMQDISEDQNIKITMVYLTPGDTNSKMEKEYNSLDTQRLGRHRKAWFHWTGDLGDKTTIAALIKNLLELESKAEIPPITEYLRHTLKAFVRHVVDSSSPVKSTPAVGYGIEDVVFVKIKSGTFRIERYENSTIRIVNAESQKYESAKDLLIKIANEKKLGIDLNWASRSPKNTRDLGKEVMKELDIQGKGFAQ